MAINSTPLLILLLTAPVIGGLQAQEPPAGGAFRMVKSTVDAGGGQSTGGVWTLTGTVGQPDSRTLIGASFVMAGGFWTAATPTTGADELFRNGFEDDF